MALDGLLDQVEVARGDSRFPFFAALGLVAGLVLVLSGCRTRLPDLESLPSAPSDFPPAWFADAAADSDRVLRIDRQGSWLHVRVGRAGRLKRLGHSHILSTSSIRGLLADGAAVAFIPVADFEVDRPDLRSAAGEAFSSEPSDSDRQGTRANLLGPQVLHAEAHPFLRAEWRDGAYRFRVRDRWVSVPVDASVEQAGERVVVSGRFSVTHDELGLEPFSALSGGLRVAESIDVAFHLEWVPRD